MRQIDPIPGDWSIKIENINELMIVKAISFNNQTEKVDFEEL